LFTDKKTNDEEKNKKKEIDSDSDDSTLDSAKPYERSDSDLDSTSDMDTTENKTPKKSSVSTPYGIMKVKK